MAMDIFALLNKLTQQEPVAPPPPPVRPLGLGEVMAGLVTNGALGEIGRRLEDQQAWQQFAAGTLAAPGLRQASATQGGATEPSVLGGLFGQVAPGTSIPEQILGPGPRGLADIASRVPDAGLGALPPLRGLGTTLDRLQTYGIPEGVDRVRAAWEATPETRPGEKFAAEALADPTNLLGWGLAGRATTTPLAVRHPLLRAILEQADTLDTGYQAAVGAGFEGAKALAAGGIRHLPGGEWALDVSKHGKQALEEGAITDIARQAQHLMGMPDGAFRALVGPLAEGGGQTGPRTMAGRRPPGDLPVHQGAGTPVGEIGAAREEYQRRLAEAAAQTDPTLRSLHEESARAAGDYLAMLQGHAEAPAPAGVPRPSAAPAGAARKDAFLEAAPDLQQALGALPPEARQAWTDQALAGYQRPITRPREQQAIIRYRNQAEQDYSIGGELASQVGLSPGQGAPHDLTALADAIQAKTGQDGAEALQLAQQHAAENGVQIGRYRQEGGRAFATERAGDTKDRLETIRDVRRVLGDLGADEDTIQAAQARFLVDRYGDTLPMPPDSAAALRLRRETAGAAPDMPPAAPESAVAPSASEIVPQTTPPPGSIGEATARAYPLGSQLQLKQADGFSPVYTVRGIQDNGTLLVDPGTGVTSEMAPGWLVAQERAGKLMRPVPETAPPPAPLTDLTPPVADTAAQVVPPLGGLQDLTLPPGLRKGGGNYGRHPVEFASDVDRALYIVGNPDKLSAADGKYLAFLQEVTPDKSEAEIRAAGAQVRDLIASQVRATTDPTAPVSIPRSFDALLGVRVQAPVPPPPPAPSPIQAPPTRQAVNDILTGMRRAETDLPSINPLLEGDALAQAQADALRAALAPATNLGVPEALATELREADRAVRIAATEGSPEELIAARQRFDAAKQAVQDAATPGVPTPAPAPTVISQPPPPVPDDIAARLPGADVAIPLGPDQSSLRAQLAQSLPGILGEQRVLGRGLEDRLATVQDIGPKIFQQLDKDQTRLGEIQQMLTRGGAAPQTMDELRAAAEQTGNWALTQRLTADLDGIAARYRGHDILNANEDTLFLQQYGRQFAHTLDPTGRLAERLDRGPRWWNDLATALRQVALITPRYHLLNFTDAEVKSRLTSGTAGAVEGARPWMPGEGIIGRPDVTHGPRAFAESLPGDMLKQAWREAGGADATFIPAVSREFAARDLAPLVDITGGGHTATQIAKGRALESENLRVIGRFFRTNHELGQAVEESARAATFFEWYDRALESGATRAEAVQRGLAEAKALHYDYAGITNADELLKKVLFFHIYSTRNWMKYPQILAEHPLVAHALLAYDEDVKADAQRGGYSKNTRIAGSIPVGGQQIADLLFSRDGTIFWNPTKYISIADQMLSDPRTTTGITGVGKLLNTASQAGLGLAPWIQIPLQQFGVYGNAQPQALGSSWENLAESGIRASLDPTYESPTKALQRAGQTALGHAPTPIELLIKMRLATQSLESPEGKAWAAQHPTDPILPRYQQAWAEGRGNPLWERAGRELGATSLRERAAGMLGAPMAFQGAGEAAIAQAQVGIPEVNATGGIRTLGYAGAPIERRPGTDPNAPLVTGQMRDAQLRQRAEQGKPEALGYQKVFKPTPGDPGSHGAPAREVEAAYWAARQRGDQAAIDRILAHPDDGATLRAYLKRTGRSAQIPKAS